MGHVWDKQTVERMTARRMEGYSCGNIARILGNGITRSAVIGKLDRLGVEPNANVTISLPRPRNLKSSPLPRVPVDAQEPSPIGAIGEFATGCKWIHGDPAIDGWRMCGHPGKPWCPYHHQRAYQKKPIAEQIAEEAA